MRLRIENEQAWFMDQHGNWVELPLTPEIRQQFTDMSERYMGDTPANIRKHYAVRVLRRNHHFLSPSTTTAEFVPRNAMSLLARMEEDIDDQGLARDTRLYGKDAKLLAKIHVTKSHNVHGFDVVDGLESESDSVAGLVTSETTCTNSEVEVEP